MLSVRRDEFFEEAPCAPGDQPQRQGIRRRDRQMTGRGRRQACPARDERATATHKNTNGTAIGQVRDPKAIEHNRDKAGETQARRDL